MTEKFETDKPDADGFWPFYAGEVQVQDGGVYDVRNRDGEVYTNAIASVDVESVSFHDGEGKDIPDEIGFDAEFVRPADDVTKIFVLVPVTRKTAPDFLARLSDRSER